jgi:hypothetical protein
MLESEEQKAQTMQDELLKRVSSLVVGFTSQRNKSLRDTGLCARKAMKEGMEGMEAFAAEHNKRMDAMLDTSQATARNVVKKSDASRDSAEEIERALGVVGGEVRTGLTNYQHAMSGALNEQITRFGRQKEEMDVGISGGTGAHCSFKKANSSHLCFLLIVFARVGRSRRARSVLTESFGADLLEGYRTIQSGLSSASRMAESSSDGILESVRSCLECLSRNTTNSLYFDNLRRLQPAMRHKYIEMILLPASLASVKPTKLSKSKAPGKISPQEPLPANGRGNTMMIGRGHKTVIHFSVNGVKVNTIVQSVRGYGPAARLLSLNMTAKLITVPLDYRNLYLKTTSTTAPTGTRPFVGNPGILMVMVVD